MIGEYVEKIAFLGNDTSNNNQQRLNLNSRLIRVAAVNFTDEKKAAVFMYQVKIDALVQLPIFIEIDENFVIQLILFQLVGFNDIVGSGSYIDCAYELNIKPLKQAMLPWLH